MADAGEQATGHRVHGMGLAMEAPTWPAITDDEAAAVLARFPAATPIAGLRWHSPRPFSAATLIDTMDGALILKRHDRRVRTVAGLAEEHGFVAHLAGAGMSVPDVLRTADGSGAVAVGEWTYELHRRGAGDDAYRDRPSWTPFLSPAHAHEAGVALARLHLASHDFDAPARGAQPLVASIGILSAVAPLTAAEAYVDARPALAAFLAGRPWRRRLSSLFAAAGDGLARRLAEQPPLWTHNDWHPSNLLWSANGTVATVFDFGLADRTCAAHDLAIAIERTAVAWLELGQGRDDAIADPVPARSLIAGYEAIRPLDRDGIDTVIRLLPLVHIEFALSEIAYFAGILIPSAALAQSADGSSPRIVVTSAATIPSPPDRAVIGFSVHGEGATSDEAVRAVVAKRDAIEKGLTGFSAHADIRAAQIAIAEVRGRDCNRSNYGGPRLSTDECAIIGYTADLQAEVRTAAVNDAGTMVSLVGRLGATSPRIERFFLAEDKEIRRRGISQALGEARLQAEAIAHASGVKLGSVITVSNLGFNGPGPYDDIVGIAQRGAPPPPPAPPPVAIGLKPRSIETQVRVQVVYAILP